MLYYIYSTKIKSKKKNNKEQKHTTFFFDSIMAAFLSSEVSLNSLAIGGNMCLAGGVALYLGRDLFFSTRNATTAVEEYLAQLRSMGICDLSESQEGYLILLAQEIDRGRDEALRRKKENHPDQFVTGFEYKDHLRIMHEFLIKSLHHAKLLKPEGSKTLQRKLIKYEQCIIPLSATLILDDRVSLLNSRE